MAASTAGGPGGNAAPAGKRILTRYRCAHTDCAILLGGRLLAIDVTAHRPHLSRHGRRRAARIRGEWLWPISRLRNPHRQFHGPVTAGVLAYALFGIAAVMALASSGLPLIAPLTGILGIIGVIVCYVKKSEAAGTWVYVAPDVAHPHVLVVAPVGRRRLAVLLTLGWILIGIPIAIAIWFVAGLWVIYRVVRGYLLFKDSEPIRVADSARSRRATSLA